MGSSDTDTGTSGAGVVDSNSSVGTIVWVRRRNGSWWPGKILGPQELSASHLMSPRSGTPVKLLGREDASVDWYNLDKSKRVKAFRCGEFDDCIERAEASHGMPPKKREKYARREDAIMHALELEKQFLEKQYGKSGSNYKSSKSSDGARKQSATSNNAKHLDPKSHQMPGQRDLAPEGSICRDLQIHDLKEGNQLSGDDDNSDALPRMRGLQDLGLRTASSNLSVDPSAPLKSPTNDTAHSPLNGGISIENTSYTNDKTSSDKRKRSNEGLAEESLVKRHDKRRPLVQVLESSAKLPAPPLLKPEDSIVSLFVRGEEQGIAKRSKDVDQTKSSDSTDYTESHSNHIEVSPSKLEKNNSNTLPATGIKDSTSGSTEDTETDSSETDSLESDTDEEMADISDESIEFRPKSMIKSEEQEHGSMSSEADDPGTTSDMSHPFPDDNVSASAGVSKWKLKGKRNTRSLTKRHVDISGGMVSRGSNPGTKLTGKGSYDSDETDLFDKNYGNRIRGYRSRALDGIRPNITSWEDLAWNDQPAAKAYWGDSIEYINPVFVSPHFGDRRKRMLVEVDLKVQSRYHREHVPMISLMSKLNGQAIVGHPIQIEALENGSSEALLATADELNQDYDTAAPPVWTTARRTASYRVPPPRSSTTVDGDEGTEDSQHVHQDRKVPSNKSNGGTLNPKASLAGKSSAHGSRPSTDRKLLKKPAKKTNVTSNQKTRTLSSIATQQKHNNHLKHGSNSNNVNGLIKPESLPAAVACIPIKLVFSRLNEKLVGRRK